MSSAALAAVKPAFAADSGRIAKRFAKLKQEGRGGLVTFTAAGDPDFDPTVFVRNYAALAAQRASKILGIFSRLDRRDGKPQYLRHMPRIWSYMQRSLDHPSLASLSGWYSVNVPKWTNEQEPRG